MQHKALGRDLVTRTQSVRIEGSRLFANVDSAPKDVQPAIDAATSRGTAGHLCGTIGANNRSCSFLAEA
jgi:hypothetical protein